MPTFTPGRGRLTWAGGQPEYVARGPKSPIYFGLDLERVAGGGTPPANRTQFIDTVLRGQTPNVVMAFATYAEALNTPTEHAGISIGHGDNDTDGRCHHASAESGLDLTSVTTDTVSRFQVGNTLVNFRVAGGDLPNETVQSFLYAADTVTTATSSPNTLRPQTGMLMWSAANAESNPFGPLANSVGGTATTRHDIGSDNQLIFLVGNRRISNATGNEDGFSYSFGVATWDGTTLTQMCMSYTNQHNVSTTDIQCEVHNDKIFAIDGDTWSISDITINTFTVQNDTTSNQHTVAYIAIDLGSSKAELFTLDSPTTTSSDWVKSGLSFRPAGGMIMGSQNTSYGTQQNAEGAFIGWFTDCQREFAVSWSGKNGVSTTSDEGSVTASSAVHMDADGYNGGSPTDLYDVKFGPSGKMEPDGWRFPSAQVTNVTGTAHKWIGLAVGGVAASCGIIPAPGRLVLRGIAPAEVPVSRPPVSFPPGGGGLVGPGAAIQELIARACEPVCQLPSCAVGQAEPITVGPRGRPLTEIVNDGKSNAIASVTLGASSATTVVNDRRVGISSVINFTSRSASAAQERGNGTMYVSNVTAGSFTITHANNSDTERTFDYFIEG